ncbi:hypothetical protein [Tepidibacillus fermentans]|uniref:Uncharacterized protein n=1 Tax=Tepidibacillus fermentans TaxID=1281767 RepID=A0A4R3KAE0_9BACI|nr:hypothetical protein [Tepidibacillus fermentans]TCS79893.1 hypothetical protein EDD72_11911 [Tepidibacillus fermentans]
MFKKMINHTRLSIEQRAELMIVALFNFLEKLFDGEEEYSEKKEQIAEQMIIKVFHYLEEMFDDESEQAETA